MNEVTARVGFDGDFLRQKETSRRLRAGEVYQPGIATRASIEAWERAGRDELGPGARARPGHRRGRRGARPGVAGGDGGGAARHRR